jgi:methylthioribulose-1-phosphate dehydratase
MSENTLTGLISTANQFAKNGWNRATAGNFSIKIDHDYPVQITQSGCFKDTLTEHNFLSVSYDGSIDPTTPASLIPSAESPLHLFLYNRNPDIRTVMHVHSKFAVVLSKLEYDNNSRNIEFQGYELQKALPGMPSHESTLSIPLFPNSQDMHFIKHELQDTLRDNACCFLLAGHGIYAWGKNLHETRLIIEAVEELCRYKLYEKGII